MEECLKHERNVERISKVEERCAVQETKVDGICKEIPILYERGNDLRQEFNDNRVILERLAVTVTTGFEAQDIKLDGIKTSMAEMIEAMKARADEYDRDLELTKKQFTELEKFSWFRTRVNRWKDNLPGLFFCFVIGVLLLLAVLHWGDLKPAIKGQ